MDPLQQAQLQLQYEAMQAQVRPAQAAVLMKMDVGYAQQHGAYNVGVGDVAWGRADGDEVPPGWHGRRDGDGDGRQDGIGMGMGWARGNPSHPAFHHHQQQQRYDEQQARMMQMQQQQMAGMDMGFGVGGVQGLQAGQYLHQPGCSDPTTLSSGSLFALDGFFLAPDTLFTMLAPDTRILACLLLAAASPPLATSFHLPRVPTFLPSSADTHHHPHHHHHHHQHRPRPAPPLLAPPPSRPTAPPPPRPPRLFRHHHPYYDSRRPPRRPTLLTLHPVLTHSLTPPPVPYPPPSY
ncbi:hypothetical protein B0H16DRAFT_1712803 [Mycena metata]|uniref:Uncharacterized protein n=1 Tax=Mycena metata TaxID=1033252 RepID=A0AAD7NV48_9AGAR|nr:hypothetical protein B0H16DRAFT_1712803 [Mycena metata]